MKWNNPTIPPTQGRPWVFMKMAGPFDPAGGPRGPLMPVSHDSQQATNVFILINFRIFLS